MKNLLLLMITNVGFFHLVSCQTEYKWRNVDEHYQGKYAVNRDCLNNSEHPQDNIGISLLLQNKIYVITLKICEKFKDTIISHEFKFDGEYAVNEKGYLILYDQHPFVSNTMRIKETRYKHGSDRNIGSRTIKVKLSDKYRKNTSNKMILTCHGCLLNPDREDYSILSYFPTFYPDYVNVKQGSLSLVKKSINQQVDSLSYNFQFPSNVKYSVSDTVNISVFVDSLKYDTVYVSNAIYTFNGVLESLSGKNKHQKNDVLGFFEFNKVVKLSINSFLFFIGDYGELYVEPSLSSSSIYFISEGDEIQNIRLIDFSIDRYNQKWVKIEFDLLASNNIRAPVKYSGWLLQDAIILY